MSADFVVCVNMANPTFNNVESEVYSKINWIKNFTQSDKTNKELALLAWEASLARSNLDFPIRMPEHSSACQ